VKSQQALDKEGKIRDISSHIGDLNPDHVNFETISKLENVDLSSLPELSSSERIGSCVTKPGKFVAIGLNYSDHAAETGAGSAFRTYHVYESYQLYSRP
jgi:2-keto-4-pentenoate hydratase/2-oxohepta-3-ene-1,7-dioic acid hydratase in catechol pathway